MSTSFIFLLWPCLQAELSGEWWVSKPGWELTKCIMLTSPLQPLFMALRCMSTPSVPVQCNSRALCHRWMEDWCHCNPRRHWTIANSSAITMTAWQQGLQFDKTKFCYVLDNFKQTDTDHSSHYLIPPVVFAGYITDRDSHTQHACSNRKSLWGGWWCIECGESYVCMYMYMYVCQHTHNDNGSGTM